mgnify:FL=1
MSINLRSPYFISEWATGLSYGTLDVSIWDGSSANPVTAQYNLRKSIISGGNRVTFEISELIRDYLDINFNGSYTSQVVWVKTIVTLYNSSDGVISTKSPAPFLAFDGYSYFEEPTYNLENESILVSNRELFVLDDNIFRIPINTNNNPRITFFLDNEIVSTQLFNSSLFTTEQIKYVSIYGFDINYDTFQERVLGDDGTFENNSCLKSFLDTYSIGKVDKITVVNDNGVIDSLTVRTIEECKYEPKKVTFINKFGALQDMYFFKKSVEKMNVEKESYKSNIISSTGTYNSYNHVNRDFNVVGKESITLSSGFLSEEYNEVFKQMMLSEKVWVTNIIETGEQVIPINVKTSEITYKTSLNNKLVEYTIEFDKSFDTINNIR